MRIDVDGTYMFLEEMRYAGWDENAVVVVVGETPMINQCQHRSYNAATFFCPRRRTIATTTGAPSSNVSHPFFPVSISRVMIVFTQTRVGWSSMFSDPIELLLTSHNA
jgi:hypothetical protein